MEPVSVFMKDPEGETSVKSFLFKLLSYFCLLVSIVIGCGMLYLVITGKFSVPSWIAVLLGSHKGFKKLRQPALFFIVFYFLHLILKYGVRGGLEEARTRIKSFTDQPYAIWVLGGIYGILYVWQQVNAYLSLEVHFLPFEYYDYMTYWFSRGKWYFTGCLHGFYHLETIMALFVPIWSFLRSPLLFLVAHGLFLSGAAIPLYFIARGVFKESFVPFFIAFVYLNFKYVFHGLEMNFCPEGLYPLTVFLTMFFVIRKNWLGLLAALAVGLLIKEDAPFYFGTLGFYCCLNKSWRPKGLAMIGLSAVWFLVLMYVIGPWSGANTRYDDTVDIYAVGTTTFEGTLLYFVTHPFHVLKELFYPWIKTKTLFSFFSKLVFLPLMTPAALTLLPPIGTAMLTRQIQWMTLGYHYALHIVPFAFIALVFGLNNFSRWLGSKREGGLWLLITMMALLNIGNYSLFPVTSNDLKTIHLARSIPREGIVLTLGHLLPYIGYREQNIYLSPVVEVGHKKAFENADYVLLAREVNTYGAGPELVEQKIEEYKNNPQYKILVDDGTRFLFKRV